MDLLRNEGNFPWCEVLERKMEQRDAVAANAISTDPEFQSY